MNDSKSRLEISKKRLADALEHLDVLVEKKIFAKESEKEENLVNQVNLLTEENKKITSELEKLDKDYKKVRHICAEVVEELSSYINNLEDIIEDKKCQ